MKERERKEGKGEWKKNGRNKGGRPETRKEWKDGRNKGGKEGG